MLGISAQIFELWLVIYNSMTTLECQKEQGDTHWLPLWMKTIKCDISFIPLRDAPAY